MRLLLGNAYPTLSLRINRIHRNPVQDFENNDLSCRFSSTTSNPRFLATKPRKKFRTALLFFALPGLLSVIWDTGAYLNEPSRATWQKKTRSQGDLSSIRKPISSSNVLILPPEPKRPTPKIPAHKTANTSIIEYSPSPTRKTTHETSEFDNASKQQSLEKDDKKRVKLSNPLTYWRIFKRKNS